MTEYTGDKETIAVDFDYHEAIIRMHPKVLKRIEALESRIQILDEYVKMILKMEE